MPHSRIIRFLFPIAVASFWSLDSLAFASTSIVPRNAINGRPTVAGGTDLLQNPKLVVGDRSQIGLRASGDVVHEDGFEWSLWKKMIIVFTDKNFFLVGLFLAVSTAKVFPSIGVDGGWLRPELIVGKYGVGLIFLLSGLSLQTSALAKAVSNMKLNGLIQLSTFVVWPFLVGVPLKTFLNSVMPTLIPSALVDGLLIMTCLPTTVNMCIMLTSSVSIHFFLEIFETTLLRTTD